MHIVLQVDAIDVCLGSSDQTTLVKNAQIIADIADMEDASYVIKDLEYLMEHVKNVQKIVTDVMEMVVIDGVVMSVLVTIMGNANNAILIV